MEEYLPFIVIGVIMLLGVVGVTFAILAEKKRRENLEQTATEMGLTYTKEGDPALLDRLARFKLFNQGRARKMNNVIQGDSGEVKIAIFDYTYTTGSGKNSNTHRQTVASIQSPELLCPDFRMRPENFFDKIGSALGFQDIDFESHPKFSELFVLQSSSEEEIRKYFVPAVLEFFEKKPGICVEAESGTMFFYKARKRVKPDQVKELLAEAYEIFGFMVDNV